MVSMSLLPMKTVITAPQMRDYSIAPKHLGASCFHKMTIWWLRLCFASEKGPGSTASFTLTNCEYLSARSSMT